MATSIAVAQEYPIFWTPESTLLDGGYIYIGQAGLNPETNPISVYWDEDLTVLASQPIRTIGGFASRNGSPALLYVNQNDYSITVKDKNQKTIFANISNVRTVSPKSVVWNLGVTGSVERTLEDKLKDVASVKDFGAIGDGVVDDTAAVESALTWAATGKTLLFPDRETYRITSAIEVTLTGSMTLRGDATILAQITNGTAIRINTATFNLNIEGGMTIDGNNQTGVLLRVQGATIAGNENRVLIDNVSFLKAYSSGSPNWSAGLYVYGDYNQVSISNCYFKDINRQNGLAGAITYGAEIRPVADRIEQVSVINCVFDEIINSETSATAENIDVDGLKIFTIGGTGTHRPGAATIIGCKFIDCKGRGIKLQTDKATVDDCHFVRNIAGISGGNFSEINIQISAGIISNCTFTYNDSASGETTLIRGGAPISLYRSSSWLTQRMYNIKSCHVFDNTTTPDEHLEEFCNMQDGATLAENAICNITDITVDGTLNQFGMFPPTPTTGISVVNLKRIFVNRIIRGVCLSNGAGQHQLDYLNIEDFYITNNDISIDELALPGITQANPAVVTWDGDSDLIQENDLIFIDGVSGMTEVNGKRYIANNVNSANKTFELQDLRGINVDSSGYTAYSSGGVIEKQVRPTGDFVNAYTYENFTAQMNNTRGIARSGALSEGDNRDRAFTSNGITPLCYDEKGESALAVLKSVTVRLDDGVTSFLLPLWVYNNVGMIMIYSEQGSGACGIASFQSGAFTKIAGLSSWDVGATAGVDPYGGGTKASIFWANPGTGLLVSNHFGATRSFTFFLIG